MNESTESKYIKEYLKKTTWLEKENANMSFSLQGLNYHIFSNVTKEYFLKHIYGDIEKYHREGYIHIHDLGSFSVYCVGWDLYDLLSRGFTGVEGKIQSKPAKHLRTALLHVVNFFYTLQGEAAGAIAFSNFDTFLAPFIRYDKLSYSDVKQIMQEFIYNLNVPTRVGFQTPFTNLTFDLFVPEYLKNQPVLIGGKLQEEVYGDFQKEMNIFNKAFIEVMNEGDARGRIFTFPIPTYNITKNFQWNSEIVNNIFKITSKYGIPYFSNFIQSSMKPEDVRSMCCRLRLDTKKIKRGGIFASNPLTGSIGVVTINLPAISLFYNDKNAKPDIEKFYKKLDDILNVAKKSLIIKRNLIETYTEQGLYPYSKFYLSDVKNKTGKYWSNHFNTIGVIGMNECFLNFYKGQKKFHTKEGIDFAINVMKHIKNKLQKFEEETGMLWNLEASPAEGASYRLATINYNHAKKLNYLSIAHFQGEENKYYTNSTLFAPDLDINLIDRIKLQEKLQVLYTGGTVFHIFLKDSNIDPVVLKNFLKKIFQTTKIPYITFTPTFSICSSCGYLKGKHVYCYKCKKECEVYSRVVGYYRPVKNWNKGKQEEFKDRVYNQTQNLIER
jgi:ribonucleoside-triphosphate reductase